MQILHIPLYFFLFARTKRKKYREEGAGTRPFISPYLHTRRIGANGYARNVSRPGQGTGTALGRTACRIGLTGQPQRQDTPENIDQPSFVQISQKRCNRIHIVPPFYCADGAIHVQATYTT